MRELFRIKLQGFNLVAVYLFIDSRPDRSVGYYFFNTDWAGSIKGSLFNYYKEEIITTHSTDRKVGKRKRKKSLVSVVLYYNNKEEACMEEDNKLCGKCKFYEVDNHEFPCEECMKGYYAEKPNWRDAYWQSRVDVPEAFKGTTAFAFTKGISKKKEEN